MSNNEKQENLLEQEVPLIDENFLPPIKDVYDYFGDHLYNFNNEVEERCSFNGEYIRYQDNRDGLLLHCSYYEESTLKVKTWILPSIGDDYERNFTHADLALHVAEVDEPETINEYPLIGGLLVWTPEKITNEIRRISRQTRMNRDTKPILDRIPNLEFQSYGGMVPFQADGKWNGWDFYFRYRSGHVTLKLGYYGGEGPTGDAIDLTQAPYWASSKSYGDPLDGCLNMDEFISLFLELASNLEDGWFSYSFKEIDGEDIVYTYAETLEKALEALKIHSSKRGKTYSTTPVMEDNRIFPALKPDFLVLPAIGSK